MARLRFYASNFQKLFFQGLVIPITHNVIKLPSVNLFSLNMVNLYTLRKLVVNRTIFMKEYALKINGAGLIVNRILDWMRQLQAAVLISLTLKRLGVINLTYPVVFPKV